MSTAGTEKLGALITPFSKLEVDDYQRTYSWTSEEVEEFFTDLKECATEGTKHFFGTLILQYESEDHAKVVDGQQRLTTTFLLVAKLRDAIIDLGIEKIEGDGDNEDIYVKQKATNFLYVNNRRTNYRFTSNRFLREIMMHSVMPEPGKQRPLQDRDQQVTLAFRKAIKKIRALVDDDLTAFASTEDKLLRINALLDALLERFLVLKVPTSNVTESLDIFLTLNNRGVPLGPSDLVRGEIMARIGALETDEEQRKIHTRIQTEWKEISDNVGEPEVFLRHFLVATGDTKVQKKRVYKTVIERIAATTPVGKRNEARKFWEQLLDASVVYNEITSPKMGGDCQYQIELLEGLMRSHRIILLAVLGREDLNAVDRDSIVRQIFVLAYRWQVAGGNAQKLEDLFQTLGGEFSGGLSADELCKKLNSESAKLQVDALAFVESEAETSFIGRALLHAIDRGLTEGARHGRLDNNFHLEHIAPQTPTDEWVETVFDGDSSRYGDYKDVVSQLGNITLLEPTLNIRAKQDPFSEKVKHYKKSKMFITSDLKNLDEWSDLDIFDRNNWLAEMFEIIWAIEQPTKSLVPFSEWVPGDPE